jgi:hypothetical protein
MKKINSKLALCRETVRTLSRVSLEHAIGGSQSGGVQSGDRQCVVNIESGQVSMPSPK